MGTPEDQRFDARMGALDSQRRDNCVEVGHEGYSPDIYRAYAEEQGGSFVVLVELECPNCGASDTLELYPVGSVPNVRSYDDYAFGVDREPSGDWYELETAVSFSLLTDTGDGPKNMDEEVVVVPFRTD